MKWLCDRSSDRSGQSGESQTARAEGGGAETAGHCPNGPRPRKGIKAQRAGPSAQRKGEREPQKEGGVECVLYEADCGSE